MSPATDRAIRGGRIRLYVQRHPRGHWEVLSPWSSRRVACETFEEALRVAYLSVAHTHDCELIVRDAYNRVVQRELIERRRERRG